LTPLDYAAQRGRIIAAKILIAAGTDVNHKSDDGYVALHAAAANGRLDMVKLLVRKGAYIEIRGKIYKKTPIEYALSEGHDEIVTFLKSRGAVIPKEWPNYLSLTYPKSCNTGKTNHEYILHQAVKAGDYDETKRLLNQGERVDGKNISIPSPLYYAASNGNEQIIRLLLKYGADVNYIIYFGGRFSQGLLHYAAKAGDLRATQLLIKYGANVNVENKAKKIPLHIAAFYGKCKIAKCLIENGANINAQTKFDKVTPLHLAVKYGNSPALVETLLAKGARLNVKDNHGWTPLHSAASNNKYKVLLLLIRNGADVNIENKNGCTPLHFGASNFKITRLLIENGADVNVQTDYGNTPLHYATRDADSTKLLIENGANTVIKNNDGDTQFQRCLWSEKFDTAKVYVDKGAVIDIHAACLLGMTNKIKAMLSKTPPLVNRRNHHGCTPLYYAIQKGHKEIIELLLSSGADMSSVSTGELSTALHKAASVGDIQIIKLLIAKKADINRKNKDGWRPLHYALEGNNENAAKFLRQLGAKE